LSTPRRTSTRAARGVCPWAYPQSWARALGTVAQLRWAVLMMRGLSALAGNQILSLLDADILVCEFHIFNQF
jgi:uncharacterized protein YjeT (DUF2065 family)